MKKLIRKFIAKLSIAFSALAESKGQGTLDTALTILISVVLGALLLAGLYKLFGETVLPMLTTKVQEMFNYAG